MPELKKHFKEIVERLLEIDPECRRKENFNRLAFRTISEIAKQNNMRIYIPYELIPLLPNLESIARCRRDFQNKQNKFNEDEFIPDENIVYEKPGEKRN